MKTLVVELSIKLLLIILYQIEHFHGQTVCTAIRQWPYHWVESGSLTLLMNGSHTGNVSYVLNYVNNYLSTPGYPICGIRTFKSARPSSFVDFLITALSYTKTNVTFRIMIGTGYSIQHLQLNYIIDQLGSKGASYTTFTFEDSLNGSHGRDPVYAGNLTRRIHVVNDFTVGRAYNATTRPTYTNRLLLFLRAIRMTSTQGNLNQLKMYEIEYVNNLTISLTIFKPLGVTFQLLNFNALYISTATDIPMNPDVFWGGSITLPETGGTFITSNIWSTSFMISGLAFMEFLNDSSVIDYDSNYSMSFISTATVFPQKPYSSSSVKLKSTKTTYFHFFRYVCPINTGHWYNTVDAKCYANCPSGTSQWVAGGKCFGCAYNCLTCVSFSWDALYGPRSNCTSCNASHFRTLVNNQCECDDSYFDNGHSATCRACSSVNNMTSTCSFTLDPIKPRIHYQQLFAGNWNSNVLPLYKSLSCLAGYILFNDLCSTCSQAIPHCQTCTNSTQCIMCSALSTKYIDGKCYLCSMDHCVMCKQDDVCEECTKGYIIDGTGCIVEPCSVNCDCGGYYLPKVDESCTTLCGDGLRAGDEQCDDSNTIDRDGCSSLCIIQTCDQSCSCQGWHFPVVDNTCSSLCGDSFMVSVEECDDGNVLNHDGCSSTCKIQTCAKNCSCDGYTFPVIDDSCSTICGDGIKAGEQECDDSNMISGDGCSSTCIKENCSAICTCDGWAFPFTNGTCSPVCGDGLLRGGEECDDGNTLDYDGCSFTCKIEGCNVTCNCSGQTFPRLNGLCTTVCGDGIKASTEECDDNNTVNGDGCSSTCEIQTCNQSCICDGYHLPRVNGSCTVICGDRFKTNEQECEDGNTESHDGCNSNCLIETLCNQSCSCDGWTRPFVSSSCSTICGDRLIRGAEECDDGNTISHDGCNSVCIVEKECNQSCLCGGWTQPYVNGSCSTICGDGITVGSEECDDNNSQSEDGCTNCTLDTIIMQTVQTQQFLFFTEQQTSYPSMALFFLGFRIVGMEMLWVIQSFQMLLEGESSNMKISNDIHGYSDPTHFPFKIPNLQIQLLDKFNYMFFIVLFFFMLCIMLETVGECCRSNNLIANNMKEDSPLTFSKGPNGLRKRQFQFEQERDHGDEEFTVHYDKRSVYINDLMSETQALSVDMSKFNIQPLPPTFFSRLSRTILRQLFFDMIMNVQPVIFVSLTGQIMKHGVESVMNFPTLITFGIMEMFFLGLLLFCWRGGEFFGENLRKFQEQKFMRYWLVTSSEKVLTSLVIGCKMDFYLYIIAGMKLLVLVYFFSDKVYHTKAQNYRCRVINVLHLVLYGGFAFQHAYLVPENFNQLPPNLMESSYTAVMTVVVGITLLFYLKQLTSKCEAHTRHVPDENQTILHQRLFYSKKDINDSGAKIDSKISSTSLSIIDGIKSKQFIPKSSTKNGQNSRITSKFKLPQHDYKPSEEYEESYPTKEIKLNWKSRTQRREHLAKNIHERQSHFRDTEGEFDQSRYGKSSKGRSFTKTRWAGCKNDSLNEQNINKENKPYESRFTEAGEDHYDEDYHGSRSAYRQQNSSKNKQETQRKAQTQRYVKSIKKIRDSSENDFDSHGPGSIRFR